MNYTFKALLLLNCNFCPSPSVFPWLSHLRCLIFKVKKKKISFIQKLEYELFRWIYPKEFLTCSCSCHWNRSTWPTAAESLFITFQGPAFFSLFLPWLSKHLPDNSTLPPREVCLSLFFFFLCLASSTHVFFFTDRILRKSVIFSQCSFNVTHLISLWQILAISIFLRILIIFLHFWNS